MKQLNHFVIIICYYLLLFVIICYYLLLFVIICYYLLLFVPLNTNALWDFCFQPGHVDALLGLGSQLNQFRRSPGGIGLGSQFVFGKRLESHIGFLWFSMVFYGFLWFSMVFFSFFEGFLIFFMFFSVRAGKKRSSFPRYLSLSLCSISSFWL